MIAADFNRRGACPTLAKPMPTGDGLLVRLNPEGGNLTPRQLKGLAESARRTGNGIVEITARGSLQIRGLKSETVSALAAEIDALGVTPRVGPAVENSPLAGLDAAERFDFRDQAQLVRDMIANENLAPQLAPKVSVVLNGGGSLGLERLSADIRIDPVRSKDNVAWRIGLAGAGEASSEFATLENPDEAADKVIELVRELARLGPTARGRDLLDGSTSNSTRAKTESLIDIGSTVLPTVSLRDGRVAAVSALPFGSVEASTLISFAEAAEALEVNDLRPAPHRRLLAICKDAQTADAFLQRAAEFGLIVDPSDPRLTISACPGAPACAAGHFETRPAAEMIAANLPELARQSLHISGCAKGCAHPAAAPITLVGVESGVGLVVNGTARAAPLAYSGADKLRQALARLAALTAKGQDASNADGDHPFGLTASRLAQAFDGTSE